jgi:mannose-6-phosphate isomerase-like protein (cupin superfamily)
VNEPKIVKGKNFTCTHAGPKESWQHYHVKRPNAPAPVRGKLFLKTFLETSGLEMSLTVFPPGGGYPFLHRHRENEETYVVLSGRGRFWVDGEFIDASEGSIVRMAPEAVRTFRNDGQEPVHLLVIQTRADSHLEGMTSDGERVEGELPWDS